MIETKNEPVQTNADKVKGLAWLCLVAFAVLVVMGYLVKYNILQDREDECRDFCGLAIPLVRHDKSWAPLLPGVDMSHTTCACAVPVKVTSYPVHRDLGARCIGDGECDRASSCQCGSYECRCLPKPADKP